MIPARVSRRLATLCAAAAVLLGAGAPAAHAAGGPETINMAFCFDGQEFQSTWDASGAVSDGGFFHDNVLSDVDSGNVEHLRHESVLRGRRGSFLVHWYEWRVFQDTDVWMHGGWYARGISGAYDGMTGSGFFSDHNFVFTDCIQWAFRGTLSG